MTLLHQAFRMAPPDPILNVAARFRSDPRTERLDLGVGVYRDAQGATPIMQAVRRAEIGLLQEADSKSYLGISGNTGFLDALGDMTFGALPAVGCQTPGGSGALRLIAQVLGQAGRTVWLPTVTWGNHAALLAVPGVTLRRYPWLTADGCAVDGDAVTAALAEAAPGDVVLLHGACHNPTGMDPDMTLWVRIAKCLSERELIPLVDLAYHGFGRGLDEDAEGLRLLADAVPEMFVAVSCSKNFALYRERTGAAFILGRDAQGVRILHSQMELAARALWSMPPDHGAEIVRRILSDATLQAEWQDELTAMRLHITATRTALSRALHAQGLDLAARRIGAGLGMFAVLPLSEVQVDRLAECAAIHVVPGGRINLAGLPAARVGSFAEALAELRAAA